MTLPLVLALGLAPLTAFAQEGEEEEVTAEAEKTEEPEGEPKKKRLRDRIKSVQRKVFLKRGRFEIFPHFGLDLNDPFFQHFIVGGSVAYHFVDSLSLELRGGGVVGSVKQSAIRFVRQVTDSLLKDPPEFVAHADIDVTWAPFYGKISLFGESILHFDTYVSAGPGLFVLKGLDREAMNPDPMNPELSTFFSPAINIGLGQRYFITDWLVVRVELRDYIFLDSRNGQSDIQNLLILGFSVSGFIPPSFEYDFQ